MTDATTEVGPEQAVELARAGALVVDVREDDEWAAGHVPESVHMPMQEVPSRRAELPEGRVVFVCRSGARSGRVAEFLRRQGHDAVNLAGGLQAWVEAGLPLEGDTGDPQVI